MAQVSKIKKKIDEDIECHQIVNNTMLTGEFLKSFKDARLEHYLDVAEEDAIIAGRLLERVLPHLKPQPENVKDFIYFITLRPIDNVMTFAAFHEKVLKLVNQKQYLDYELVFEQKGETSITLGHGFHAHIIARVKPTTRKRHIIDKIQSQFYGYIGANQPFVQPMTPNKNVEYYKNYIRDGKDKVEEKSVAHGMDSKFRKLHKIKDLYSHGSL